MKHEGGCLCGTVRYAVEGGPRETVHCHCRMCQKASGAPFVTWVTFAPKEALTYTGEPPAIHHSSAHAQREFCGRCGSQLAFRGDRLPGIVITVATLDDPSWPKPLANTWAGSRLAWLHGFDETLPDLDGEWPGDET